MAAELNLYLAFVLMTTMKNWSYTCEILYEDSHKHTHKFNMKHCLHLNNYKHSDGAKFEISV
jgi:hypothetical protein